MPKNRRKQFFGDRPLSGAVLSIGAALVLGAWAVFGPNLLPIPDFPLRVGVRDRIGHAPFLLAADHGFLDPARVRVRELASSVQLAHGLRNGTFDAIAMTLEEALEAVESGGDLSVALVLDESRGSEVPAATDRDRHEVLVLRTPLLASRPQDVRDLLQGWFHALEALTKDREIALARLARSSGFPAAELERALATVRFVPLEEQASMLGGDHPGLAEAAVRVAARLRREGRVVHDDLATRLLVTPLAMPEAAR